MPSTGVARGRTLLLQRGEIDQPVGIAIARCAWIERHRQVQLRQLLLRRVQLSNLFLVFRHRHTDAGGAQHAGDGVLIGVRPQRHANAAERLRCQQRGIQPRSIVADDRQPVPGPKTTRGEATRKFQHQRLVGGPAQALPDAAALFPPGRPVANACGVSAQQAWQRISWHHAASRRRPVPRYGADHRRIVLHLVRRAIGNLTAAVEHAHPVGNIHHHRHVMFDQYDRGAPLVVHFEDEAGHVLLFRLVHPTHRFVEQ